MIRIVESKFITSAVNVKGYPDSLLPEFAFVGRSNVGKSSMINAITNRKLLAKIANTPGKTRLINFFGIRFLLEIPCDEVTTLPPTPSVDMVGETSLINVGKYSPLFYEQSMERPNFMLVDLPGYGYAKVSKSERTDWKKMINEYFQYRKQLTGVVVLVDIRHQPDIKDVMMIKLLSSLKIDFIIAATKCDKIPKNKILTQVKILKAGLGLFDNKIYEFSSVKKIGIDPILAWIENRILVTNPKSRVIIH